MNTKIIYRVAVLLAVLTLAACASTAPEMAMDSSPELDAQLAALQEREAELDMQESKLNALEEQLAQQQHMLDQQLRDTRMAQARMDLTPPATAELLPPKAAAGECYARAYVPPTYRTVTKRVLKHEAGERLEIIPAQYETAMEKVLVEEASERLETIPATYAWKEEKVLVEPAKTHLVQVPARYETVSEKMLVKEARTVWKKGTGPIQRIDEATGEIMCLVEEPAEFRTVTKRVLKQPVSTREEQIPAVYKTIKKRVLVAPPSTQVVQIPAKYKTIEVTKMVAPAREKRIPIPAEYQTVTKQVMETEGRMEWRSILCETNMTRDRITQIQMALKKAGHDPGPIDGVIGSRTMAAVNDFQRANKLPVDKYLNIATVKALGVSPR